MRINDISVSRCHAIIKCKTDGFYIEDNTSKFGTIILLKDKLRLKASHTMAVQVGRTVISFTIRYVQSEKEKLKSDISKVLDAKKTNKAIKPPQINNPPLPKPEQAPNTQNNFNQNYPIEMQQTFAMNIPMENNENNEGDDANNDNEPRQMDF